jgi:serine protease inhibitor
MGAEGQTQKELSHVLGFDLAITSRSQVIKNYLYERAFQALRDRDPNLGYELTHANKLYFDRELPISKCFQLVLQDELEAVDFDNAEKARKIINGWVKEKTKSKIPKLLPQGALDGGTKVALVNAAYFKVLLCVLFDLVVTEKLTL